MRKHFGAILLAGGQSSRMGQDKASLEINGQTLIERLLFVLRPIVEETVVIRAPGQALPRINKDLLEWIKVGWDSVRERGPLQGIVDALPLLNADIDKIFIITCDLPYLTSEWLQLLRDIMTEEYDIVCTEENNITNPLLGIYKREVLEAAEKIVSSGKSRPILLWEGWKMARLSAPEETPWICMDANTPLEFEKAKKFFKKKND
tara:strand:+ start:145 stop:759 length:615 start_codon:yes stop_codon:yes gene_type:complete